MHYFEDVFLHNRRGVGGLGLGLGRMRFGQFVRTAWRRLGGELGVQVRLWVGVGAVLGLGAGLGLGLRSRLLIT